MTEFKCGNCREVFVLSPKARFCPECGSSSLNLVIKELKEPSQKETIGVYSPPPTRAELKPIEHEYKGLTARELLASETSEATATTFKEEEDQPRRPRRRN